MTKVWGGVILLALLLVMAWASFTQQRVTLVIDVTVEPFPTATVPVTPEPEFNFLPTITPRPLSESVLLPTVGR